tara:strand:+ start:3242 stop:3694 length:453 start_codon:yes stop_codon:yes gene_type:complete
MSIRSYTTRRQQIVSALVEQLKLINGFGAFLTDVGSNVEPRLKFWDEVDQFPAIHVNSGSETRQYQGGGYKDRFLSVTIRCYVNSENSVEALDKLLEDVETVLETNSRLQYTDKQGQIQYVQQITVVSIDTDEGALDPLGVGEMTIEVRY